MLSIMSLPGEEDQERVLTGDGSEIGIEILADGCKIEGLKIENFRGPGIYVDSDGNEMRVARTSVTDLDLEGGSDAAHFTNISVYKP